MSLAMADQILLTRSAFDNARQVLKGEDIPGLGELFRADRVRSLKRNFQEKGAIQVPGKTPRTCEAPCEIRSGCLRNSWYRFEFPESPGAAMTHW
jgi:hypothetical protein